VYLPADPEINAPAIAALPQRHAAFVRNTTLLLREQHGGPTWPAVAGYSGLAIMVALWTGLLAFVAHRLGGAGAEPAVPQPPAATRTPGVPGQPPGRSSDSNARDRQQRWRD
jgi:hypothetical protein